MAMKLNAFRKLLTEQMSFVVPSPKVSLIDPSQYLELEAASTKPKISFRPFVVSFASLVLAAIIFLGGYLSFAPTASVTLDINPSFVLSLNAFNRVIGIEGEDEDAEAIIAELGNTRGNVHKVIRNIYLIGVEEGSFTAQEAYLLFGVASGDYNKEQKLKSMLLDIDVARETTIYVMSKHSEPTETFSFRFALIGSAESSPADYVTTAIAQTTANYWTQSASTVTTATESAYPAFGDMINDFTSTASVDGALSETEYLELASTLSISEAKLQIVLEVFVFYDEYDSAEDLLTLASLDLKDLFSLYEPTVSP